MRRAKLYYLRGRVGKRARVRERRNTGPEEAVQRELLYGPEADGDEARLTGRRRASPPSEAVRARGGAEVETDAADGGRGATRGR